MKATSNAITGPRLLGTSGFNHVCCVHHEPAVLQWELWTNPPWSGFGCHSCWCFCLLLAIPLVWTGRRFNVHLIQVILSQNNALVTLLVSLLRMLVMLWPICWLTKLICCFVVRSACDKKNPFLYMPDLDGGEESKTCCCTFACFWVWGVWPILAQAAFDWSS